MGNHLREVYQKAAWASYENCLGLLEEATILSNRSKFARAYALCVLSCEEFVKSFLYKGVSAGLVKEHEIEGAVKNHGEKILRFIHLMLTPYIWSTHYQEIHEAMEHDRNEPDHAKHLYVGALAKALEEGKREVRPLLANLREAHMMKMRAFYVDILGGNLVIPKQAVGKQNFEEIHRFLSSFVRGFDVILNEDDDTFRKVAEQIDPDFHYVFQIDSIEEKGGL